VAELPTWPHDLDAERGDFGGGATGDRSYMVAGIRRGLEVGVARWRRRSVVAVIAVLTTMSLLAGGVAMAYVRRTRPPWPAVAGDPYVIESGVDGCPIVPEHPGFVDAPGLLVPPDPTKVVLCTIPTEQMAVTAESQQDPRLRALHAGAAEFAAFLNGLPDRNQVWLNGSASTAAGGRMPLRTRRRCGRAC
jgi:hypothetical protein